MKTADIPRARPSGSFGRRPKNLQGTCPLTHYRALPEPVLAGRQEKSALAPFLLNRIIREPYVKRLSRHILALRAPVFHGPPDNGSAPFMHFSVSGDLELSVDQGRSAVAIFRAYCQRLPAFLLCSGLYSCCVCEDAESYSMQPTEQGHSWHRRCCQIRLFSVRTLYRFGSGARSSA